MKSSKSIRNVNQKNIKSHVVGKVSVPLQSVVDHQSQENNMMMHAIVKEGICQKI